MSNRKIQITLFAALTAIGLAMAPAVAVAKSGEPHSASPRPMKHPSWGNKGSKVVMKGDGGHKPDKWSNHKGGKHDKHDNHDKHGKHDKHDSHDKHDKWKHHAHHKWWHHKKHYEAPTVYYRPAPTVYYKPAPTYTAPTYAYAKPAYSPPPAPCTCLTKEYTSDGKIVFKDLCTKEMAVYSKDDDD